jgi:hypothetical protein
MAEAAAHQTTRTQRASTQYSDARDPRRCAMPVCTGIGHLQRALGNRGMTRLLRSGAIQTKLMVGPPDDEYEREADRVADEVMRMPEPTSAVTAQRSALAIHRVCSECEPEEVQRAPLPIQRVCPGCDEEVQRAPLTIQRVCLECEEAAQPPPPLQRVHQESETLQRKPSATTRPEQIGPKCSACQDEACRQTEVGDAVARKVDATDERDDDEEGIVQATSNGGDPSEAASELESYVAASQGGGQPLPASTRAHFESRFGHDFSGVHVHTDSRSADAAARINSYAFARGLAIHFGAGRFQPGTPRGDRLLAHELTHTIQQTGGRPLAASGASSEVGNTETASAEAISRGPEGSNTLRPGLTDRATAQRK